MNGHTNGVKDAHTGNYALPRSHQDLMEKSLVDTDPDVAEIMVRLPPKILLILS